MNKLKINSHKSIFNILFSFLFFFFFFGRIFFLWWKQKKDHTRVIINPGHFNSLIMMQDIPKHIRAIGVMVQHFYKAHDSNLTTPGLVNVSKSETPIDVTTKVFGRCIYPSSGPKSVDLFMHFISTFLSLWNILSP